MSLSARGVPEIVARERRRASELRAETDALTLEARAATALNHAFSYDAITNVVLALLGQIDAGKDVVRTAAELRHWLTLAISLKGEEAAPAGADWASMSEAQRASLRATMLRLAEEREAEAARQAAPSGDPSDPRLDD